MARPLFGRSFIGLGDLSVLSRDHRHVAVPESIHAESCVCVPCVRGFAGAGSAWRDAAPRSDACRALWRAVRARAARGASFRTARHSSMRCRCARRQQIMAEYRASAAARDFDLRNFVAERFAPAGGGNAGRATAPCPARTCAQHIDRAVERARAQARRSASVLVALAAAGALHRAGRPLQRDLLLGLVLHDARPGGERPARPDARRWSRTSPG